MLDLSIKKLFKKIIPSRKKSEFVKKQQAINESMKPRLVWDSSKGNTYIFSKHGKLT